MNQIKKKFLKHKIYLNRLHTINALIYLVAVYCFAALAAYYSYSQEKAGLLQSNHEATVAIEDYYAEKQRDFWTMYIPIFNSGNYVGTISEFLRSDDASPGTWLFEFAELFSLTALQDDDIRWILICRTSDRTGYIFDPSTNSLAQVKGESQAIKSLAEKEKIRQIYGTSETTIGDSTPMTYAIAGGAGISQPGSIMIGYKVSSLHDIYEQYDFELPPRILLTTSEGAVIFDSSQKSYGSKYSEFINVTQDGVVTSHQGNEYYLELISKDNSDYRAISLTDWEALTRLSHKNTAAILGIATLFVLLSASLYLYAGHKISRRVNIIGDGLAKIGQNDLSFRIPLAGFSDEFGEIARNINSMSQAMENNIQELYIYQLKQRTAELGELQSKFDPHFLYNTLEVIRANIQENGDDESANMIMLLSRIFRNSISGDTFVTIREEITACSLYLELFKARYRNNVEVLADIETGIIESGIIRNLLQPIIENYFIHGIDPSRTDNQIILSAAGYDGGILFTIKDNGIGISSDRMKMLHQELNGNAEENTGYGLHNVNDRIRIFYGPEYGINVHSSPEGGTEVFVRIAKMSCEQHKERMQDNPDGWPQ
jgi:sensor histidine kinase YesM